LSLHLADTYVANDKPVDVLFFAPDWAMKNWLKRRRQFHCATTDLSAPGVDFHSDITHLPSADHSYDLILCSHVLEHVPEDSKAISEIYRVLRPGGRAMIQVPWNSASDSTDEDPSVTDVKERERRFGQFDHVRLYGRDLVDRLGRPGFNVEVLNLMSGLDPSEARKLGLWDDEIFVCKKPGCLQYCSFKNRGCVADP
jgi:SAM-dependent methyltransferase